MMRQLENSNVAPPSCVSLLQFIKQKQMTVEEFFGVKKGQREQVVATTTFRQ